MPTEKHIPVTEETRKELHELKEPGETYDDLLRTLVREHRRKQLAGRFRDLEETDRDELTRLEDG